MRPEELLPGITAHLQQSLAGIAEPLIQDALRKFEAQARDAIARTVMTTIEAGYSIERRGLDIHITVRLPRHEGDPR